MLRAVLPPSMREVWNFRPDCATGVVVRKTFERLTGGHVGAEMAVRNGRHSAAGQVTTLILLIHRLGAKARVAGRATVLALIAVGTTLLFTPGDGRSNVRLDDGRRLDDALAEASKAVEFRVVVPAYLPEGLRVVGIATGQQPATNAKSRFAFSNLVLRHSGAEAELRFWQMPEPAAPDSEGATFVWGLVDIGVRRFEQAGTMTYVAIGRGQAFMLTGREEDMVTEQDAIGMLFSAFLALRPGSLPYDDGVTQRFLPDGRTLQRALSEASLNSGMPVVIPANLPASYYLQSIDVSPPPPAFGGRVRSVTMRFMNNERGAMLLFGQENVEQEQDERAVDLVSGRPDIWAWMAGNVSGGKHYMATGRGLTFSLSESSPVTTFSPEEAVEILVSAFDAMQHRLE